MDQTNSQNTLPFPATTQVEPRIKLWSEYIVVPLAVTLAVTATVGFIAYAAVKIFATKGYCDTFTFLSSNTFRSRWNFTESELDHAAEICIPDYVDIVRYVCQHRLLYAPGDSDYAEIERWLLQQPSISVPTVTLNGTAEGNSPATNGSTTAKYLTGKRMHRQTERVGHNLPQEKPEAFVDAIVEVNKMRERV
ncbi:hypothetical protein N0V90_003010 [Kalmusia sp. IMI 367209]|nr:hypothetical protein N0V90_003010 [Kalmusia sp. IMI 367209]